MARIIFIGGGIVGTCAAMMLANDGHDVIVLERDPAPAPSPDSAWDQWERRGVNQFRMLHSLLARFRSVADAELPGLTTAMESAGALRNNPLNGIPPQMSGGVRDGDDRFTMVTARRPVAEAVVSAVAASTGGLTVRRGVAVKGLLADTRADGIVHVRGVATDSGETLTADVVIDAGGRRSAVPGWLRDLSSPGPRELIEDCGFVYYGRHYRSADGSVPPAFGPPNQPYGSVSTLTLAADNGTWGVGLTTSSKDPALRALADNARWERALRAHPLVAHWIDAEPITDVQVMAKIEDRQRTYVIDGVPVATGILPLADASSCTNPSVGRGLSIGLMHAAALRSLVREVPLDDAHAMAVRWFEATQESVEPYIAETLSFDRHRLAEIEAHIEGRPYETEDQTWWRSQALRTSAAKDPDLLRAFIDVGMVLACESDVMARPGLSERAHALADSTPLPGPSRAELVALVTA